MYFYICVVIYILGESNADKHWEAQQPSIPYATVIQYSRAYCNFILDEPLMRMYPEYIGSPSRRGLRLSLLFCDGNP